MKAAQGQKHIAIANICRRKQVYSFLESLSKGDAKND